MPGKVFNINTDSVVRLTRNLELAGKRHLPNAVRNTLNNLAFDTKKRTLPQEAEKAFTTRNKTFYKRYSKVKMARGKDLKTMKAIVGMNEQGAPASAKQAIDDQTQQQVKGTITGRTLIPLDDARVGGNRSRNVRSKFRTSRLNVDMDTAKSRGGTEKDRFINTAITAVERFGGEAIIKHKAKSGTEIIYHVKKGGGKNSFKTREFSVKVTGLYSVKEGRAVRITKAKPFTLKAANRSMMKARKYFKKNAEREFKKLR